MSLQTWKDEFYPVEARDATGTELEAVEHSLRKWRGLQKTNLAKHGVSTDRYGNICNGHEGLTIDGASCALCQKSRAVHGLFSTYRLDCKRCPLYQVRGEQCDRKTSEERISPWAAWMYSDRDPKPMIKWLRAALKHVKARAA